MFANAWPIGDPHRTDALSAYWMAHNAILDQEYSNASELNNTTYTDGEHTATIRLVQGEWMSGSNRGQVVFLVTVMGPYTP